MFSPEWDIYVTQCSFKTQGLLWKKVRIDYKYQKQWMTKKELL